MAWHDIDPEAFLPLALILMIVFTVCLWVLQSNIEANVYNRETGANITTWEAMWTNLRVDCK